MKEINIDDSNQIQNKERSYLIVYPYLQFLKAYEMYPELIPISFPRLTLLPHVPNLSSSSPDDL